MTKDMFKLTELLSTMRQFSTDFYEYDRVYPFTTENLQGYMRDINNKSVLSVVGSGDHYMNLVSMGAKSIDCFDINRFAINYLKLKKAAALALDKNEFLDFLTNDADKYFERVKEYLELEVKEFWDYYFRYFINLSGMNGSFLFYPSSYCGDYISNNPYLSDDGFIELKSNLEKQTDGCIYQGNIYSLADCFDKKYDLIFLSNICGYQSDLDRFKELVLKLKDKHLADDGKLYYGYFYRNKGFGSLYYPEKIIDTESIKIPSAGNREGNSDKVLFLSNKKSLN